MGYSHGKKWTEESIVNEIKMVMKALNIDRMPSHSEMNKVTESYALSNQISKKGGTVKWSKKLDLKPKNSCTLKGEKIEKEILKKLKSLGFKVKLLNSNAPYDILVNDKIKIEIKYSSGFQDSFYTFNLYKGFHKSDIHIFVGKNKNIKNKILIIPSFKILGLTQMNLYQKSSYDKYIDRWDYITEFNNFLKNL